MDSKIVKIKELVLDKFEAALAQPLKLSDIIAIGQTVAMLKDTEVQHTLPDLHEHTLI